MDIVLSHLRTNGPKSVKVIKCVSNLTFLTIMAHNERHNTIFIIFRIDQCYVESREQVENISHATIKRLLLELETGGNVRFEDGTTSDVW